jgi:hypothetical protein
LSAILNNERYLTSAELEHFHDWWNRLGFQSC